MVSIGVRDVVNLEILHTIVGAEIDCARGKALEPETLERAC